MQLAPGVQHESRPQQHSAAGVIHHACARALQTAGSVVCHGANGAAAGVSDRQRARHDLIRWVIALHHECEFGRSHQRTLAAAVGVRQARAVRDRDAAANIGQILEREVGRTREQTHSAPPSADEAAGAVVIDRVAIAQRPVVDEHGARLRQRQQLGHKHLARVFFCNLDALGVGRHAYFDLAWRGGQHQGLAGCRALVHRGRLGAAVGHDLRVDRVELQPHVIDLRGHRKAAGAIEHAGVAVHRLAHQCFIGLARVGACGRRAGVVI